MVLVATEQLVLASTDNADLEIRKRIKQAGSWLLDAIW